MPFLVVGQRLVVVEVKGAEPIGGSAEGSFLLISCLHLK